MFDPPVTIAVVARVEVERPCPTATKSVHFPAGALGTVDNQIQSVMEADIPAPAEMRLDLVQLELGRPSRPVAGF